MVQNDWHDVMRHSSCNASHMPPLPVFSARLTLLEVRMRYAEGSSVCPFVRLVIYAYADEDIEINLTPYERVMFVIP